MQHSAGFTSNEIGTPTFHAYSHERGVYEETTFWNPTWALNSGNMNATVADVGRWSLALNRGELLDDESFELQMAANTAGLSRMTEQTYFSFGMLIVDDAWIVGNPSLQGYQGFTGQLRDPEVTIVVYSTGSVTNTGDSNASVTLGARISEVMAPDMPLVMPT
jgi:D-alanyl-D-alanine carboxypeptidase